MGLSQKWGKPVAPTQPKQGEKHMLSLAFTAAALVTGIAIAAYVFTSTKRTVREVLTVALEFTVVIIPFMLINNFISR